MAQQIETRGIEHIYAKDGRQLAIVVRGDFDAYSELPPFLDTEEERADLAAGYAGTDPETERRTKAHITSAEMGLQITLLNRVPGAVTKPHYHDISQSRQHDTRYKIMMCTAGKMRANVWSKDGDHVTDVELNPGDLILTFEGHGFEFLEPGTKSVEIMEGGPFAADNPTTKVDLHD